MKLTAKVKLQPNEEQHQALLETLEAANMACNYISDLAWREQNFRQYSLHKLIYYQVREQFGLSAQVVIRCIGKVADSYKANRRTEPRFEAHGAISFDARILRWYVSKREISIWTMKGRLRIAFITGNRQIELLNQQRGESDLAFVDGQFYLFASCEVEIPEPEDVKEFLGIDLGVKNIASDSDGKSYAGNHLNNLRKRHSKLRTKLQSKGTKSAKRLLKKRRHKERHMANDVNHVISKKIVVKAKDTARGIALEDLSGIRERVTVRKGQRRQHNSWGFYDLRQKIEYKAKRAGVVTTLVDPRDTSRTCPICDCVDKANRKTQNLFLCVSCHYASNADTNAAVIISRRAAINQPNVSDTDPNLYSVAPGTNSPDLSGSS